VANSTLSNLAARMTATAAATATAMGGTVVTSDIVALAAVLNTLAVSQDVSIPLIGQSTTPALASTMLTPA
jgi:hypothetical protein